MKTRKIMKKISGGEGGDEGDVCDVMFVMIMLMIVEVMVVMVMVVVMVIVTMMMVIMKGKGVSSLVAKGLDISLAALKRQDPYINTIVDVASQVALYTYNNRANEWEKTEVEGTLLFTQVVIHGIWFYDKEDCQRIAQRMKFLTHQEQVQAQSQGGWLSPGGNEGKPVDIIQMLSKARNEYDKEKSSSEPKEIGGSSVLYGNPNLIKPIPVKPHTQESESSLSLATLFGTQPKRDPAPPSSSSSSNFGTASSSGKLPRPHVVRTLTYENTTRPGQNDNSREQKVREDGRIQQQQQDQSQHCPAIQKLMQGQRGVLQTVSESPENRLCDNGLQYEHQHVLQQSQPHVHHHHIHQPQHNQQQFQQQIQMHPDPIKRLFQSQPPVAVAPQCCPVPQNLPVPVQPMPVCHQHQNQPLVFSRTLGETQHNCHVAAHFTGFPVQMPGVVSPHELLQKLQIVQQEQNQASSDPPQSGPVLTPSFMGTSQTDPQDPGLNQLSNQTSATAGQKAALQFQVISPQRIPATVAPTMLLSPSVFSLTKPSPPTAQATRPGPANPVQILSRSQLQATLLHLIQNDSSFLDSIYEAYSSRFSTDSCCKY
ncbi:hypothetical protein WMY93_030520 [Mugilogobius chulae]|uniref:5'-(N(7)-methylguanosine 5'-triphospho)-[mRNA] hydrolase n=1 Tax=Mugilogobius chulae TaxID=88201 RepID=A0AAW0MHP1_9GOBI